MPCCWLAERPRPTGPAIPASLPAVYQHIQLADPEQEARVSQVVDFGPTVGFLRVSGRVSRFVRGTVAAGRPSAAGRDVQTALADSIPPCLHFLAPPQVEAEANTDRRPLPGFTPRSGEGLPFGIMGKSSTQPPARPNLRVDFQFDQ